MPNNLTRYRRYVQCKRCGKDVEYGPHVTHRTFCSRACRETYWADEKSKRAKQSEVVEQRLGPIDKMALTPMQAVWLAGIIDGEGTISIWRERRPKNRSGYRYRAVVEVYNTNRDLIAAVLAMADGFTTVKYMPKPTDNHKQCFKVVWNRRAIPRLLEMIQPHLVAKRKQADIVLRFCEELENAPMRASQVHEILEGMWAEVKELNRRGIAKG